MCGPINVKSSRGASYFVTFIDDASKKVWAYPMKKKGEVFEIFQNFHVVIERKTNKLLKCLRIDNGGEYCSNAFKDYYNRFGIKHEKIVPGTPQHNGTVERMNRTIMDKVRSMLSNSGLENHFWEKVVRTTCYLIYQSPTTTLDGGIPKEIWIGKKVNYSHLKLLDVKHLCKFPKK